MFEGSKVQWLPNEYNWEKKGDIEILKEEGGNNYLRDKNENLDLKKRKKTGVELVKPKFEQCQKEVSFQQSLPIVLCVITLI